MNSTPEYENPKSKKVATFDKKLSNKSKKRKANDANSPNKKTKTVGPEEKVIARCVGDKYLFAKDLTPDTGMKSFHAWTWEEVYQKIVLGKVKKNYCHLYEHRIASDFPYVLENFVQRTRCVAYFDIDDFVAHKEDHNREIYLNNFKHAVQNVLGIDSRMRVQEACGHKGDAYKVSYHILFPDVHFESHAHLRFLCEQNGRSKVCQVTNKKGKLEMKEKTFIGDFEIDMSVYHKGYWRMPWCTKKGSNRVLVPLDVKQFSLQAFKELSIHFVPESSCLINVEMASRTKTTNKRTSRAIPASRTIQGRGEGPLMLKAKRLLGVKGEFEVYKASKDGEGITYKAISQSWTCCHGREHFDNKCISVYEDRVNCLCTSCKGFVNYPPLADELMIQNEAEIRKLVCEFWNVKNISVRVDGKSIVYTGGRGVFSRYDQSNGRLQHKTAEAVDNVALNDVKKMVRDYHKVEEVEETTGTKKKKHLVTYSTCEQCDGKDCTKCSGLGKISTYNKNTKRLVLNSNAMVVEPIYHIWSDTNWGTVIEDDTPFVASTATIDGTTITCDGTFLPKMKLLNKRTGCNEKITFDDGTLSIPVGSTVGIQANMGLGKTHGLMLAIKQAIKAVEQGHRVLFVTYRCSLAYDLFKNLSKKHNILKVLHYQDGMDGREYKPSMVNDCNVMVCQAESIWKAADAQWDLIVTDEVQSLSSQFSSGKVTFRNPNCSAHKAFQILRELYARTPTAIFMDADLEEYTPRGIDFINTMRGTFTHIVHRGKPEKRDYVDCGTKKRLHGKLEEALEAGYKVVYTSNTATSIDAIVGALGQKYKIVAFYGQDDKHSLTSTTDINLLARDCDLLCISSGKIGSGVSIEDKLMFPENGDYKHKHGTNHPDYRPFDMVFVYGVACDGTSCVRELNQASCRCRNIARKLCMYTIQNSIDMNRFQNYKNSEEEVSAIKTRRDLLYRERRGAAAVAADELAIEAMKFDNASAYCISNPVSAAECSYDPNLMMSKGLIPSKDFNDNLLSVQKERIESIRNMHSIFVARIHHDAQRHWTLESKKNSKMADYKPIDRLPQLLAAVPESYRKWKDWNVPTVNKIKSRLVQMFRLDHDKSQKDWAKQRLVDIVNKRNHDESRTSVLLRHLLSHFDEINEGFKLNAVHNQLLEDFFEDKQTMRAIDQQQSYPLRCKNTEELETMRVNALKNWAKHLHGNADAAKHEVHKKFSQALESVFVDFIPIKTGKHKGKKACYEPLDDNITQERIANINKLVPRAGKLRKGTEWQSRTNWLLDYFKKNGVKHCMKRFQFTHRTKKDKKEAAWVIDDTQALEYASMMGASLTPEQEARRSHKFDTLRQLGDEVFLKKHFKAPSALSRK